MSDTIDAHAEWSSKLQTLRAHLAHIPYAARHQESIARPLAEELEAAYQAQELPEGIAALWEEHRLTVNEALARATDIATQWDADFPVFETRPGAG